MITIVVILFIGFVCLYVAYLRQRGGGGGEGGLTLTSDELADIERCEEYHQSGKGIDHPDFDDQQYRISSLVARGVYQAQNEHGDWVWHKVAVDELSYEDD